MNSRFSKNQKVCLLPEAIKSFILDGYIPHDFNPDTIGELLLPKKELKNFDWIFCYNGNRLAVEEDEIQPVYVREGKPFRISLST